MSQEVSPELLSLIKSYLKRKGRLSWIDWLPLIEAAADSPLQLVEAFNSLGSTSSRAEFVELLAQHDSGPLADSLLILLAKHALQITDEQVRDFVVEDVSKATERTAQRLKAMESVCEPLREQAAWVSERLKKGFDIAHEIARLEAQLADLRAEEHGKAEEYDQIHARERDIIRLETFRRTFAGYDFAERSRHRDNLVTETDQLRIQKESMQQAIANLLEQRDAATNEVNKMQQQHDTIQANLTAALQRGSELTEAIARLQTAAEKTKAETRQLQQEHADALARIETEERARKEAEERIRQARERLQELREQAGASGRTDIENRIREVYAMLPQDEADKECR